MPKPLSTQPAEPKGVALLIDDNERYRSMLTRFVQSIGYFCALADDGVEALEWLDANPRPDVMLCDLHMPRMDGIKLLEELQKRGSTVPVLVISAVDDADIVGRCIDLGAVGYVTKPFRVEQLRERIARAISR